MNLQQIVRETIETRNGDMAHAISGYLADRGYTYSDIVELVERVGHTQTDWEETLMEAST